MKGADRILAEAILCYYLAFSGCMKIRFVKVWLYESKSLVLSSANVLLQDLLEKNKTKLVDQFYQSVVNSL